MDREIGRHQRGFIAEPEARTPTHRLPIMNAHNAPRTPAEAHFDAFCKMLPSEYPSQIDRLDRLLAALDKLTHCEQHRQQWMGWILSGRFGQNFPAALERLVLELAMQRLEIGQ